MKPRCYFCDIDLEVVVHTFRVGLKEEPVCEECHVKTVNRKNAKEESSGRSAGPS